MVAIVVIVADEVEEKDQEVLGSLDRMVDMRPKGLEMKYIATHTRM